MQNINISRTLFIVIFLIFFLNAIISTANVFEDGALLRRIIPAVCWGIATVIWIATYVDKRKRWKLSETVIRVFKGENQMKILEKSYFSIVSVIFSIWFIFSLIKANIPFTKDFVIFIIHWISELIIIGLGIIISIALFQDKIWSKKVAFFSLGMILSSTLVASYSYMFNLHNVLFSIIAGIIFISSIPILVISFRNYNINKADFHMKFILLSMGILINFHLDIILSYILHNLWAAFIISLFILIVSCYYLILIIKNGNDLQFKVKKENFWFYQNCI